MSCASAVKSLPLSGRSELMEMGSFPDGSEFLQKARYLMPLATAYDLVNHFLKSFFSRLSLHVTVLLTSY